MQLNNLITELERQKSLKWDKKVSSSQVAMVMPRNQPRFQLNNDNVLAITKPCHKQVAERLNIPTKYYQLMADNAPELLLNNVNTWLQKGNQEVFIRGLGESARAFLSDRYRIIDHLDILYCSLNELQAHEAQVENCFLSETEINIKVKSNKLQDFVRDRDDLMIGGLLITNSETGHKALRIEPRLYRVKCTNGMVIEEFMTRQIHLGNSEDGDDQVYLSIRRSIRELFERFGEIIQSLRDSTEIKINNPKNVIKNVVKQYRLSEVQRENILMSFGAEPDNDQYGIANAITRSAQMEKKWEDSLELERLGGKLVTLPFKRFKELEG